MKTFLLKGIRAIRAFLDKAETVLDEPRQSQESAPLHNTAQKEDQENEQPAGGEDILVPFSNSNFKGAPSTYKDRKILNALIDEWVHVSGIEEKQAKSMLRKHSGVQRIDYMTVGQVDKACGWLREQIAKNNKSTEG